MPSERRLQKIGKEQNKDFDEDNLPIADERELGFTQFKRVSNTSIQDKIASLRDQVAATSQYVKFVNENLKNQLDHVEERKISSKEFDSTVNGLTNSQPNLPNKVAIKELINYVAKSEDSKNKMYNFKTRLDTTNKKLSDHLNQIDEIDKDLKTTNLSNKEKITNLFIRDKFSIADELNKLVKLKKQKQISEQEFKKLKSNLLRKI